MKDFNELIETKGSFAEGYLAGYADGTKETSKSFNEMIDRVTAGDPRKETK
jgi:hypothetical protein